MVFLFMVFKHFYPQMYTNNLKIKIAPCEIPEGFGGWARAAWSTPTTQFADHVGVDMAMLLEYSGLCMEILAIIGIPMMCIFGPLNYLFGGFAAGPDHLSYFSFGNIKYRTWHYWMYAFVVWGVVYAITSKAFKAQKRFCQEFRYKWLKEMPEPRATTVLVENIPEPQRSDVELKKFFDNLFTQGTGTAAVASAVVVKDTAELLKAHKLADAAEHKLEEARALATTNAPAAPDAVQRSTTSHSIQVPDLEQKFQEAEKNAEDLRAKVLKEAAEQVGGVNLTSGFVTFTSRTDALIAENMIFSDSYDEMIVSIAPPRKSIIWADLREGPELRLFLELLGYGLVAGLYILYLPIVMWIGKLSSNFNMGAFQSAWQSIAPTLGLQIMVAMLPTFLISIFKNCFVLKDEAWSQHCLQNWYFVFQVVFVIAVTAIGGDATNFAKQCLTDPTQVPMLLGTSMPYATHFYMNFMVMQWMTHSMNLTRYFNLIKYLLLTSVYDKEKARELAEPEDQDYYGIGSRSARFSINMLICIIFGTLCPWMNLLGFINFFLCRIFYGYLMGFAENEKPDLGGVFWVQQLRQLFVGCIIYVVMMTGVLYARGATSGPAIICVSSLILVVWRMKQFEREFVWEKLPFIHPADEASSTTGDSYVQPELLDAHERKQLKKERSSMLSAIHTAEKKAQKSAVSAMSGQVGRVGR
jgi:hypothetical protein